MNKPLHKNIVIVDFDASDQWSFFRALEASTGQDWELYKGISNRNHGDAMQKIIRYIKYFLVPFKIFLSREKIDQVLAWQQFNGFLAFYFKVFKVKATPWKFSGVSGY